MADPELNTATIRRVLLVEDELAIREGIATCLRLRGIEVLACETIASAKSCLSEGHTIDAAITDWQLPDGLAEDLRSHFEGKPWVVVSGQGAALADRLPEARVLTKPVGIQHLIEQLFDQVARVAASEPQAEVRPLDLTRVSHPRLKAALHRFRALCDSGFATEVDEADLTLRGRITNRKELSVLAAEIGGDLLVRGDRARWRLHRDGAPEGACPVRPGERFAESPADEYWVDFQGLEPAPALVWRLCDEVRAALRAGRTVIRTEEASDWAAAVTAVDPVAWPPLRPIGPSLDSEAALLWDL